MTGTAEQPGACPGVTTGTKLLSTEEMGYCLLYPDDLNRLAPPTPAEVCLVPEGPTMECNGARAFFEVNEAAGRSASQAADQKIAQIGSSIERSNLTIAGEQAVVLDNVPGQDRMRIVLLVHDGHLYTLSFVLPDAGDASAVERFERLYATVIHSFTFLPTVPTPTSAGAGPGTGFECFL